MALVYHVHMLNLDRQLPANSLPDRLCLTVCPLHKQTELLFAGFYPAFWICVLLEIFKI